MPARSTPSARPTGPAEPAPPLASSPDPLAAARAHIARTALSPGPVGRVGLELELHLVDHARPARRPTWPEVQAIVAELGPMPAGSAVTVEPGGQVELSGPPAPDAVAAVAGLRMDRAHLRRRLAEHGYGAAPLGTDPARSVARINPAPRYDAMEAHFDALGCAGSGRAMMAGTAALQVNLDAGPRAGWDERLGLMRSLVPVLVALSSTSPLLGGRASGWHSMRQGTWQGIDCARTDPVSVGEPAAAWAFYALSAPVMLLRTDEGCVPVTERVPFAAWLRGHAPFGRAATLDDLDYHLTTLFPPVRPRGYLELRCLDAMPDRWWPALVAIAVTLLDDPVAADAVREQVAPVADAWETAARDGLADPRLRAAAQGCVAIAARHCPEPLRPDVERLAELLASGRTPSSLLRERIDDVGPLRVLEEESR